MSELKKCPFCGGEAKLVHIFENTDKCMVSCRECDGGIDAVFANEEEAVTAWNHRAGDEVPHLTKFAKEVHANAVDHGLWDGVTFDNFIGWCTGELSEALDEYCHGNPKFYISRCPEPVPKGIAVELADCILLILSYCGKEGIDIETILKRKHEYNKTRPYKHGGKRL